jgi:hypothetical protein
VGSSEARFTLSPVLIRSEAFKTAALAEFKALTAINEAELLPICMTDVL